jgi:8-oxo-dGTP pyrophosphatase MutT (NUDIX family)
MYREVRAVTAFIESDGKILLLLRSDRVSTYAGKWGGVSGSIDDGRTADEQALVEIEEETGLSRDDIMLVKKGEPLVFDDKSMIPCQCSVKRWRVYFPCRVLEDDRNPFS